MSLLAERSGQPLHLTGEIEVLFGEAAGGVGDKREADAVVADVDVGVMASLLGKLAYAIDEVKSGDEVREFEGADELAGFDLPAGKLGEAGLSGIGGKGGHGGASMGGDYTYKLLHFLTFHSAAVW